MEVKVKKGQIESEAAEALVLMHFEDEKSLPPELQGVDKALGGLIKDLVASGEFRGRHLTTSLLHTQGKLPAKRVLLIGLGKRKDFQPDKVRQAIGRAACRVRELGIKSFSTPIPARKLIKGSLSASAQALVEGAVLGLYQFTEYRTEAREEIKAIKEMVIVEAEARRLVEIQMGSRRGQIIAEATNFVRDMGNQPSNILTPTRLARIAQDLAKEYGMTCQVLERSQIEKLGMGALAGVARGSQEPPKFIILEYHGSKRSKDKPVALIGKSITFDSGGISLKPAEKMEQMKDDMSGGAAVLGTFRAVAQLQIPVSLVGILPATENMPSGTAIKPGDVLKTLSGKTVEVINTDAEGRLVLSDALNYALRYHPAVMIDLATLTGACVVALGQWAMGMMGKDDRLKKRLSKAGESSGERVWELPMWEEYFDQIKSDVADIKNVGGRGGGAITAGAFLSKFVGETPWVHLDIAGTAWTDQDLPYMPKGSTGSGVRLLVQFLTDYAKDSR
jgi:leucyl aminopeptidase